MLSRISLYRSPAVVEAIWRDLEARSAGTAFQSFRWQEAWSRLVAPKRQEEPLIVVGHDDADRPVMLLPLALRPRQGTMVLSWLGQDHATYAMGLYAAGVAEQLGETQLKHIVDEIVAQRPRIAALSFKNQPAAWAGIPNPFTAIGAQEGANRSYRLGLEADFDGQANRILKKHARGKLRRAMAALTELPGYRLDNGETRQGRLELLDCFLAQKARQLAERGIANPFASPEIVAFYRDLAGVEANSPPLLECLGLVANGQFLATAMSISFQDQRHLLTLSLGTDDPEILKHSPGLALMRHHIGKAAADGITGYDFGAGDGQHKSMWQPVAVPLFDTYVPLSVRGYAVSLAAASGSFAKRLIKNNQRLWQAAQSVRRLLKSNGG